MTDEFNEKMSEAIEKGVSISRELVSEYLETVKKNSPFADLYMELVLAYVVAYNYNSGHFENSKVSTDTLNKFGRPTGTYAYVQQDNLEGVIVLDYLPKDRPLHHFGEPAFRESKDFNMDVVNEILSKNGIHIREDRLHRRVYISFDASMLIESRNKFLEEIGFRKIR